MSGQEGIRPGWFTGTERLYDFLLELTAEQQELTAISRSASAPPADGLERILDFLSDELTAKGFGPDWEISPLGQNIETLIDVFNELEEELEDDEEEEN
ncbi:hypothetical protein [Streptomyces sp. NPDC058401]|uniref:hypothetical protein n=1 Tax=Streptomyces sp. NPDC058401 TaxID=3346480 RepID=UPI0036670720